MAGPLLTVYFDTSALVKLYAHEPETDEVRTKFITAERRLTSVITYAELCAALAAMQRGRRLTDGQFTTAKLEIASEWPNFELAGVDLERCYEAGDLAEQYALRGCDSIQLACYAHLVKSAFPNEIAFCCFDKALSTAATRWRSDFSRR